MTTEAFATNLTWNTAPDGVIYTTPRRFTIEQLPNGLARLFHYGPGTSSLHTSIAAALIEAEMKA